MANSGSRRKTSARAPRSAAATRARASGAARSRTSGTSRSRSSARTAARSRAKAPVQIKWVRLSLLALVLIAVALYINPLRSFFTQQTKYAQQQAILATERQENKVLTKQVAKLKTTQFILEKARADFQLVPQGVQVFVVKGLPSAKTDVGASVAAPQRVTMSLSARLSDLWQTILQ